ncbi:MAG: glycosyltransferase family 4 protein [Cytophagales bacterium]|nr:glycosyltransferase family 4 protein [Cytophagales bacterium]
MNQALSFQESFGSIHVIHAHVAHPGGYVAMQLAKKLGVPYIISEHMGPFPFVDYPDKKDRLNPFLARPYHSANLIVAVSQHLKRQMEGKAIRVDEVIPNFIDDDFFSLPASPPIRLDPRIRFAFVGRWEKGKGLEDLLAAWRKLEKSAEHIFTVIAGDGSMRSFIEKEISQAGLRSVEIRSQLDRTGVRQLLWESDVLLCPSHYENNPLIILEALACGRPVVATRNGGAEELIHSGNGVLINKANPDELAAAILYMTKNHQALSPKSIREDFEQRWGTQQTITRWDDIYTRLVE